MPIEKAVYLYIVYLYAIRDPKIPLKLFALRHFLETCPPDTLVHHELFASYVDYIDALLKDLPTGRRRKLRCIQSAITCDFWVWLIEQDVLSTRDHQPALPPRAYPN